MADNTHTLTTSLMAQETINLPANNSGSEQDQDDDDNRRWPALRKFNLERRPAGPIGQPELLELASSWSGRALRPGGHFSSLTARDAPRELIGRLRNLVQPSARPPAPATTKLR